MRNGAGKTTTLRMLLGLAEAAQTVDDVVVIARGRLVAQGPVAELAAATATTRIRTPDAARLLEALAGDGINACLTAADVVETSAADPDRVAKVTAAAGVVVLELTRHTDNLEGLFCELTSKAAGLPALEVSPS
jgi:ABC-2 type transport system ATP-binding protein